MPTRGEAQAALDAFIERTSAQSVTEYVRDSSAAVANQAADMMAALFARLESLSQDEQHGETAVAVAEGLFHLSNDINALVGLAVGTAIELGGGDQPVRGSQSWTDFVDAQQALVDSLPDEDEETNAILADADAMAAIEEAENEERGEVSA